MLYVHQENRSPCVFKGLLSSCRLNSIKLLTNTLPLVYSFYQFSLVFSKWGSILKPAHQNINKETFILIYIFPHSVTLRKIFILFHFGMMFGWLGFFLILGLKKKQVPPPPPLTALATELFPSAHNSAPSCTCLLLRSSDVTPASISLKVTVSAVRNCCSTVPNGTCRFHTAYKPELNSALLAVSYAVPILRWAPREWRPAGWLPAQPQLAPVCFRRSTLSVYNSIPLWHREVPAGIPGRLAVILARKLSESR